MKNIIIIIFILSSYTLPMDYLYGSKNKIEDLFYLGDESIFPKYWNEGSLYSSIFEIDTRENFDVSTFFESKMNSYAFKTGTRMENANHRYYDVGEIKKRVGNSSVSLFIASGVFKEGEPNFDKLKIIMKKSGIYKDSNDVRSTFLPELCGILMLKDENNNIEKSIIYISEESKYKHKMDCIDLFSPAMFGIKPFFEDDFNHKDGFIVVPDIIAGSIGYCRSVKKENFNCISYYLENVSEKILNLAK